MQNRHPFQKSKKLIWLLVLLVVAVWVGICCMKKELALDLGNGVKLVVVRTPDNVWWGKYEVTQEQWLALMRYENPLDDERQIGPDKPVLQVETSEIGEFLKKLNALRAVKWRGLVFRLPDRGEWETACLAGSGGNWPLVEGGREGTLDEMAWYGEDWHESHLVGMKVPNAYGLYDMLGNASERTTTETVDMSGRQSVWYAGGDISFKSADFAEGGRSGTAEKWSYAFAGFRICSPARGLAAWLGNPVEKICSVGRSAGGGTIGASDEVPETSGGEVTATDGGKGGEHGRRTGMAVPEEVTAESIMEMAKKQAAQKAAEGDWEGAQKILESARAMAEAFGSGEETFSSATALPATTGGGRTAGETKTITLPGGATMEMVWCPPGCFTMGSPLNERGRGEDETQHEVTLTEGFWMAKTEVTQKQWKSVMGTTVRQQRDKADPAWGIYGEGADYPIYYVNWEEAQAFCRKTGMRLPTEAQWEYACRAGSTGAYGKPKTGGTGNMDDMGWCGESVAGGSTHPVGRKQPNAWGLYDMHGNVWEWCADWYTQNLGTRAVANPPGPAFGAIRVLRGGCYWYDARDCRSAVRFRLTPGYRLRGNGFRPVALQK